MAKTFTVTESAAAQARAAGVYGDTAKRLMRMARRAAPFTHARGNRRFNQFVLTVQGDQVVGVGRLHG